MKRHLLGAVLVAVGVAGCGQSDDPPPALPAYHLHTVQPVAPGALALELTGAVVTGQSLAVGTPVDWAPMEWVVPEGTTVAAGDPLMRFEERTLRQWLDTDAYELAASRARAREERLSLERELAQARAERRKLEAELQVQDALIEASLAEDDEQLRIARLRLAGLERRLATARGERERLQPLVDQGFVGAARLARLDDRIRALEADLAPARIAVEDIEAATGAVARARARIEHARLALHLAADGGDLVRRLEHLATKAAEAAELHDLEHASLEQIQTIRQRMVAESELQAGAAGVVEYSNEETRAGGKVGNTALFVLDEDGIQVRFLLPDQRDLLGSGGGTPAVMHAAALPGFELRGTVRSVSALSEPLVTGVGRGYPVLVELATDGPTGLAFGMSVTCRLELPLGEARAAVPSWAIADLNQPAVTLADGTTRALEGHLVGDRFVVASGLEPGVAIRLASAPPAPSVTRISAPLELADFVSLGPESWRLELISLIPDGSRVEVGEEVARFVQSGNNGEINTRAEVVEERREAAINLERTRREVNIANAEQRIAWQEARLAVRRAEIDLLVERYASYERVVAEAEATLVAAAIARDQSRRTADELDDPVMARGVGALEQQRRRTAARTTDIAHHVAEIDLVAAARERDQVRIWELEQALAAARSTAGSARRRYALEQERGSHRVAEAQQRLREQLRRLRRERELLADLELSASAGGRVFHTTDRWGRKLEVGSQIPSGEIMRIETGPRRRATFEIPVRHYPELRDRRELDLVVPALGDRRLRATVVAIGHAFREASGAAERLRIPDHIGGPDRVFECTVLLDLDPGLAAELPPGVTVHVDLPG